MKSRIFVALASVALWLAAPGLIEQARAQNLLNNPGFETAGSTNAVAKYWAVGEPDEHGAMLGNSARVNWRHHGEDGEWIATIRGTWAGAGTTGEIWQEVAATPSNEYTFSAWFWADASWGNAARQEMKLIFLDSATNEISATTNAIPGIGESWVQKSMTATAPTNAAWVRVVISASGVPSAGALQFDDLSLTAEEPGEPDPEPEPTGNLLNNPSFETAGSTNIVAKYWAEGEPDEHGAMLGSGARVNWRHHGEDGEWSATIRGTWAGAGDAGVFWQEVPAVPGALYEFFGWFWADNSAYIKWAKPSEQAIRIEFFDSQTNLLATASNAFFDVVETWVQKSVQATSPSNTAWARVVVFVTGAGDSGSLVFDELSLTVVAGDDDGDTEDEETTRTYTPEPVTRRSGLVVSEIMYNPPDRADGKDLEFLEIYNTTPFTNRLEGYYLTGDVYYAFGASDVLPPFGYLVVAKDPSALQSVYTNQFEVVGPYEGKLPNSKGTIQIKKARPLAGKADAVFVEAKYKDVAPWPLAADGAGHSLALTDGTYGADNPRAWSASSRLGGTPGGPEIVEPNPLRKVVINEFLAHTDEPEYDFIELYNTSTNPVDIGGAWLSDSVKTNKFQIPAGTIIPARGFAVFLSNTNIVSETNLTFNLTAAGEDILFRAPDGTVLDAIRFGAQANGVSVGRTPDGAADYSTLANPTPGAANAVQAPNTIVINEIMYNPISGDNDDEYVELYNATTNAVDIGNWRLEDGITFRFPAGTTIAAGGYLVVARNTDRLLANYPGVLNSGNTIGNYSGSLANSGERVALVKPDDPGLPEQDFVLVSEVTYSDGGQWGEWSDGGGSSLELIDPAADTRRASNWADSDETQKAPWTEIEFTGELDHGILPSGTGIDEIHVLLLRAGEALVDDVDVHQGAGPNRASNPSFDSNFNGWTAEGNHKASGRVNEGHSSGYSLGVRASGKGDTGANRIKGTLSQSLSEGQTATIKAYARWLRGDPNLLLRVRGNYLEAYKTLTVPKNLGTPGEANSRKKPNAGPAIWDVSHSPSMPAPNQDVRVTARVQDPNAVSNVALRYRIDPSQSIIVTNMKHIGGGVYRGTIPGQASGKLVAFHVLATDAQGATNVFPLGAPEKEALVLFGESANKDKAFGAYRFWMTQANMDEWKNREKQSDHYLDMTFVNGDRVIYNASARWRGSPFTRPSMPNPDDPYGRASFRVKFPSDEPFLGNDELNLDSLERDRDDTMQRERAAYQIAERMGLTYSYQRYIYLSFNGMPYSYVYADVMHIEKDYIKMWFPDEEDGETVKIDDWPEFKNFTEGEFLGFVKRDATLENFTTTGGEKKRARYRWNWVNEPKGANPGDPLANILRLVDAANLSGAEYTATLESVADIPQWMRVIALRHLIGDWDSYGYKRGKNMSMYRPPNGRWQLIPWDMDFALGANGGDNYNENLFVVENTLPRVKAMLEHPPFRRYYWQALNEAVRGPLLSGNVNPAVDETYAALTADGVSVSSPNGIKSWVNSRRNYTANELAPMTNFGIAIRSVATNGNMVTLSGVAPIQMYSFSFNGVEYQPTWTSPTNWSVTLALTSGATTVTVAGYDQAGQEIGSASRGVSFSGSDSSPEGNVIFNEIMYQPSSGLAEFVELHNRSTNYAFDLTGYRVDGLGFSFEQGTVIPPNGYIVLVENLADYAARYTNLAAVAGVYGGKLDNSGEILRLLRPDGTNEVAVDEVFYDRAAPWPQVAAGGGPSLQLIDGSQSRLRVGNWAADTNVLYTPGAPNSVRRSLPALPEVWLNELQTENSATVQDNQGQNDPWVELYNAEEDAVALTNFYLTDSYDDLMKWRFPAGSSIESNEFSVVWLDNEPGQTTGDIYHASFRPAATNGSLALVYSNAGEVVVLDYLNYSEIEADQSYGDYPDGNWTNRSVFLVPTPGAANDNTVVEPIKVRINEYMADNKVTIRDPDNNAFEDWIELYNYGASDVDLSGFGFTDSLGKPFKWVFPAGVTIHAGEYLLVWADSADMVGNAIHTSWGLGKKGEDIGLFTPSGDPVDTLTFGAQTSDVSEGRCPDGTGPIGVMSSPTPGAPNCPPVGANTAPVLEPIGNQMATEHVSLTFVVTATDAEAPPQTLTYSLDVGAPSGATINATSGVFEWTPGEEFGGTTNEITIRVTDDGDGNLSDSETIQVVVLESNEAPEFGELGTLSVAPGSLLTVYVTATDSDMPANNISFSLAQPAPAGATIDSDTGVFTWTPDQSFADSSNAIQIVVSDDGSPAASATGTLTVLVLGMQELFDADVLPAEEQGTNFVIRWNSESGTTYRVERADELPDAAWTALAGDVTATGAVSHKEDADASSNERRFYRILRLSP